MESRPEEYELNGDLRPGSPGSPEASADCSVPTATPLGQEPAHQCEPLRQQEERGREHAGHRAADGQRLPAEGRHRAGPKLHLLRAPGGPHHHLPCTADWCGRAAHLPWFRYDLNNPAKHAKLDFLNNLATGLIFIIVVVNIFITAFGVQKPVMDVAPRQ
ncbi:ninjurin-1 isoform 1-T1 [Lycaon pictus]